MTRTMAASSFWPGGRRRCSLGKLQQFVSAAQPPQRAFPVADLGDGGSRRADASERPTEAK
jgi:hypothetical protein